MGRIARLGWRMALVAVLLALAILSLSSGVAEAQGPNLLQNPGFERPYVALPTKENCRIAAPWVAYWYEGSADETKEGYRVAPEFKAAFRDDYPGNRVRSGELSQQYFHSFGNFQGGVYQQVSGIPVGARLRFEMWGMTWSCDNEKKGNCAKATSGDPSPMRFRIGIDTAGGVDALNPNIAWSPEQNAYDDWRLFQVEAVAKSSTVTVFVYAYPEYRSQDNNVYIDDAYLQVVAAPATATRRPTATPLPATATPLPSSTPVPTATPLPTATPPPTATMTVTPQPTATPLPPTATLAPTEAPPTATTAPSMAPQPTATEPAASAAPSDRPLSGVPLWYLVGIAVVIGALIAGLISGKGEANR
jgi:hypothetical protein